MTAPPPIRAKQPSAPRPTHAVKEAKRTAPEICHPEDCVAEFGEGQCQQTPAQAGVALSEQAQKQRQLPGCR